MKYAIPDYDQLAEDVKTLVIEKVKSNVMVPVAGEILRNMQYRVQATDLIAMDIAEGIASVYAPASSHEVDAHVWVCEVPDGRWQMFKAALGLRHRTKDVYGPKKTVYHVCPHLNFADNKTHIEWLSKVEDRT